MAKYRGYRAKLERNTTGSTYVNVGQILELGEVGSTRALMDVSAHGDEWMDFLGGRQEGTELMVRVAVDPLDAQLTALKSDYDSGLTKKFHVTHPDYARIVELTAVSVGYLERYPQDGAVEAEITLKIVNPGVVFV